jgi:hypothetical protein
VGILDEHLLRASEDKEVFVVIVAVQRHHDTGRQHAAHHAKVSAGIIWAADEFDGWPEYIHCGIRGSGYDTAKHPRVVMVSLHFCVPSVGEAGWP